MILDFHIFLLLISIIVWSIECGLESVAINDGEFPEHYKSRGRLLLLLVGELAIVELEKLVSLPQHVRYHSDQIVVLVVHQIVLGGYASVHEDVPLFRVAVYVTKDDDLILTELLEQVLRVVDSRM